MGCGASTASTVSEFATASVKIVPDAQMGAQEVKKDALLDSLFAQWDKNKDDFITLEEAQNIEARPARLLVYLTPYSCGRGSAMKV